MDPSFIPVCPDTDRTALLKHPKFLAAPRRDLARPPVTTYISEAVLRIVTGHVVKLVPRPNQANIFEAQRFMRTVKEGCFSRPTFCIMICGLLFVPEGQSDTECRRYNRKIAAELAVGMWDLLYCTDPGYTCKEHHGAAAADDDVRTQSHALFENLGLVSIVLKLSPTSLSWAMRVRRYPFYHGWAYWHPPPPFSQCRRRVLVTTRRTLLPSASPMLRFTTWPAAVGLETTRTLSCGGRRVHHALRPPAPRESPAPQPALPHAGGRRKNDRRLAVVSLAHVEDRHHVSGNCLTLIEAAVVSASSNSTTPGAPVSSALALKEEGTSMLLLKVSTLLSTAALSAVVGLATTGAAAVVTTPEAHSAITSATSAACASESSEDATSSSSSATFPVLQTTSTSLDIGMATTVRAVVVSMTISFVAAAPSAALVLMPMAAAAVTFTSVITIVAVSKGPVSLVAAAKTGRLASSAFPTMKATVWMATVGLSATVAAAIVFRAVSTAFAASTGNALTSEVDGKHTLPSAASLLLTKTASSAAPGQPTRISTMAAVTSMSTTPVSSPTALQRGAP